MEEFADNSLLKILHNVFLDYSGKDKDYITKMGMIKFFFDYKIIDTCGYNIFHLNEFLHQLNPEEDKITLKMFLMLIFYIYRTTTQTEEENSKYSSSTVKDMTVGDVNKIADDRLQIYSSANIVKIILNQKEQKISAFQFESPNFENEDIITILSYDLLTFLSSYMKSIENQIFNKYSVEFESNDKKNDLKYRYINITKINTLIFDYPIFKNFNCDTIAQYLCMFIKDISKVQFFTFKSIFDERMDEDKIVKIFDSLLMSSNEINFTYSSIVILLTQFALKLESSEGKSYEEAIKFLFEEEFGLKTDSADLEEQIQEEEEPEPDYDYIPESETLNKAKINEIDESDPELIKEFLFLLDSTLPECDVNILSFANDQPKHSNLISHNPYNVVKAKYPLERLYVEVEEEKAAALLAKETRQIERAKKPKRRNARDPPPKELYMEELPKIENYELKYRGKPIIDSLTYRLIKRTIKELLPNNNVYPCLIREALIIPLSLPSRVKEIVVECYKDHVKGHIETAICRLEKAEAILHDSFKNEEAQCDLFFALTFGWLYESLNLNIIALKYYQTAKSITDNKMMAVDPDSALVYCYLGAWFLKMNEIEWSMRCFQKAKEIREANIGGDTLDTAAVYNNLGVVSFWIESFLPAKNYFNLAYEITRKILGLAHPRTIQIKNNLTKLNQLSFNKTVQFKTLSLYPTPAQAIPNNKRKKKK